MISGFILVLNESVTWVVNIMPFKTCPSCGAKFQLRDCVGLLFRRCGECQYCGKYFRIKRSSSYVNTAVISSIIGIMAKAIIGASIVECVTYSIIFIFFFQRFIDFFYDLEVHEE